MNNQESDFLINKKSHIVTLEDFNNYHIDGVELLTSDEVVTLRFPSKNQIIFSKGMGAQNSIQLNDPELLILFDEYYSKQNEITTHIKNYSHLFYELERNNVYQSRRSYFYFTFLVICRIMTIVLAIYTVITMILNSPKILKVFNLESEIWTLFIFACAGLIGQIIFRMGFYYTRNVKFYLEQIKNFKENPRS